MLVHTIKEVREQIKEWEKAGLTVGLVPTMGALHNGHLSLIKKAVEKCDKVVVSVFVNPIQFCQGEDLDKYPRTLEADQKLCESNGVNIVFAPTPSEMYGDCQMRTNDFLTYVIPPFFYVNKLCGKSRVGHFDGVCTVVNKLFNIVQPDFAFFGQKDAQQLIIIKKMVKDLNIPVEIIPCPIVREESGLALSSRNKYLSEEDKIQALALSKILNNIKNCYKKGITDVEALKETAYQFLNDHHDLEYLEFMNEENLDEMVAYAKNISAKLGSVIAMSGAIDIVADENTAYIIRNGHSMMSDITGTGCMLSSVVGVFISANPDNILKATAVALSAYGLAGELAYKKTMEMDGYTSTLRMNLIDYMGKMNVEIFQGGAKIEVR